MKQRILAITLTVALLMGTFATTGLSVGAADNLFVTKATVMPVEKNILTSSSPTSGCEGQDDLGTIDGKDVLCLKDGKFSASATDGWEADFVSGSRIVFYLGGIYNVEKFLIGSVADEALYAQEVSIYVSKTRAGLFTEDSLVTSTVLKEKGNRVTQPGETLQNSLVSVVGKRFEGRYVAFDFSAASNQAVFGDTIKLGELGAYGTVLSGVATTTKVTSMPDDTNLLHSATITSGFTGKKPTTHKNDIILITDGKLAETSDQRWGTPFNDGDRLTFDLGRSATIYKYLIGSEADNVREYVASAKIYVSDDPDKLYTEDSLVLMISDQEYQNYVVTSPGTQMTGRYVAFDFTSNNLSNGGTCRHFFRLGELAVYGLTAGRLSAENTNGGVSLSWDDDDNAQGYYVYRRQDKKDDWTQVAQVTDADYVDTTAKNNTKYSYTVRSYAGTNIGPMAKEKSIVYVSAPTVKATASSGKVKLTWKANKAASKYVVYRQKKSGDDWSDWSKLATVTPTAYTDAKAKNGVNYRYAVKAVSGSYSSDLKASSSVILLSTPKAKVSNVTKGVKISWNKITGASKYYVYRRTGKTGDWSKIKTTSSTSYTDTKAKAGKVYYYRVKAVKSSFTSDVKTTAGIRRLTVPAVKAAKTTKGLKVTWSKVTKSEKYVVYRRTGSGSWKKLKTTTSRSYVDKTAKKGKYYSYYVLAVNGGSKSYYKATKKIKR